MRRYTPLLALLLLSACAQDNPVQPLDVQMSQVDAQGAKVERNFYSIQWSLVDIYVPCLDETVSFLGYANLNGYYHVTPSGNYIDVAIFDLDTDEPYVLVRADGTEWPLATGEDNNPILEKATGQDPGIFSAQANFTFRSEDGRSRLHWRAHYTAEGIDWNTGELLGVQRQDDVWTCHLAR